MRNFGELCLDSQDTKEGIVALYLDDQISEESLIKEFGNGAEIYGLIALNNHLSNKILYELSYALLIEEQPKTQVQIDDIFERLGR
jgi:hypothetical protein